MTGNPPSVLDNAAATKRESDSSTIVIQWTSKSGYPVKYISPDIQAIGYETNSFINQEMNWWSIIHPDDLQRVMTKFTTLLKNETSFLESQYRIKSFTGDYISVEDYTLFAYRDAQSVQHYVSYVTIQSNLSARHNHTHYSESVFQGITSSISDGLLVINPNGKLVFMNTAAEQILGWELSEVVCQDLHDLIHQSNELKCDRQECAVLLATTGMVLPMKQKTRFRSKSGDTIEVEVSSNPLFFNGRIAGSVAVFNDISILEKFQKEHEAMQEQLVLSHKMEALGRFASHIVHDFKNILNSISITASAGAMSTEEKTHYELIQSVVQKGNQLTNDLLTYSSHHSLVPEVLDVKQFISSVLPTYERLMTKRIKLNYTSEDILPSIKVNKNQLEQILMNLLANAKDALLDQDCRETKRQVHLNLSTVLMDYDQAMGVEKGGYVQFEVSDNGIGMDPSLCSKVTEPYVSSKKDQDGHGLGLSIVYTIVKQSDGHMMICSKPGEGTCIRLLFPIHVNSPISSPHNSDISILVVDDDLTVLESVQDMLLYAGYNVIASQNPEEALNNLRDRERPVDVVICDIMMPMMNGIRFTHMVHLDYPDTPVILMSGHIAALNSISPKSHKNISMLQKPFSMDQLTTAVEQHLTTSENKYYQTYKN